MEIDFTKMHGLGNDFVVIDALSQRVALDRAQLRAIADRRRGIGCDQILLVEAAQQPDTDFYYRIFNADGGEVEQCGNGARCIARFVRDRGLSSNDEINVGTAGGNIRLFPEPRNQVRVDMGQPRLAPDEIPFDAIHEALSYPLKVDDQTISIGALSMGNPHAVLLVNDVAQAPLAQLGPAIERHPRFPKRTNVGFMAVRDRNYIDLRVFERGVGETRACGTGACAAVVYGRLHDRLDSPVQVHLPGGALVISWQGIGEPVWMTGPAVKVFDGRIDMERLVPAQPSLI